MILNTGSRTDIPAYFSKWFYNRIKEGYVLVRNPYNSGRVTRYRLSPDVVDCMVFCTKNPQPMLEGLDQLEEFRQFWHVSITAYGKEIEPGVPDKMQVIESFQKLSEKLKFLPQKFDCLSDGFEPQKRNNGIPIGWRYDPIFISQKYTVEYHLRTFEKIAQELQGYTNQCVISFIDLYQKTKKNFPEVNTVSLEDQCLLGREMIRIAEKYGMKVYPCCEGRYLEELGADCSGCLSQKLIEELYDIQLIVPKQKSAREGCNCLLGSDIGVYNTCSHGCRYCYANYDQRSVVLNRSQHDENSPLLIGHLEAEDMIKEAKQESWIDQQLSFKFI